MAERQVHVWMYLLKGVPAERWPLVMEFGFRPAKKSSNWYRWYDNRLAGAVEARLRAEAMLDRRSIPYEIKPLRSRFRRVGKITSPSAERWARENREHLGAG